MTLESRGDFRMMAVELRIHVAHRCDRSRSGGGSSSWAMLGEDRSWQRVVAERRPRAPADGASVTAAHAYDRVRHLRGASFKGAMKTSQGSLM